MKHLLLVLGVVLILAIAGGGWWLVQTTAAADASPLEATGIIEARQVSVAPEIGGKVVDVMVEEGEPVTAGQPLVKLDDTLLIIQRAQAAAALRAAQANLALLQAGATTHQIQAAEAQLAGAEANVRLAQATLDGATAGTRPEAIAAMRAHLELARTEYEGLTVTLTADQIEKVRSALVTAETNLTEATARRDSLTADSRNPAFVAALAESAIADAQTAVDVARQASDAVQTSEREARPYALQIELARLSWEVALANVAQSQARLDALREDSRGTPDGLDAAEATLDDSQEQVEAAQAAYEALSAGSSAPRLATAWTEVQRAQTHLAAFGLSVPLTGEPGLAPGVPLEGGVGSPSAAPTSVETLLAQVDGATALRAAAAANLAAITSGARAEQVEAAQAQVDAAQAQVTALELQLAKLTLAAPWDGVVLLRSVEPGQIAPPGGGLLEIGRLDSLELTVYLPEERFGLATPGQEVSVRVDAYAGRTFSGRVLRIADEAEFTPTNAQTKEDRSRLVYAVVIGLDNPDLALKPGMIADVVFGS